MRSICVFCGSMPGNEPKFTSMARQTGEAIAQAGARLIYGGGNIGLMGQVAQGALSHNGAVLGVIPEFLKERENASEEAELRIVATMSARKAMMIEEADGFIVLPGGTGTLEEVFDMLSRRRLGQHEKPVAFVGEAYWGSLKTMFETILAHEFTPQSAVEGFVYTDDIQAAIKAVMA